MVIIETTTVISLEFGMKKIDLSESAILITHQYMYGYHRNHYSDQSRVRNEKYRFV
jgi:hypothetical protein